MRKIFFCTAFLLVLTIQQSSGQNLISDQVISHAESLPYKEAIDYLLEIHNSKDSLVRYKDQSELQLALTMAQDHNDTEAQRIILPILIKLNDLKGNVYLNLRYCLAYDTLISQGDDKRAITKFQIGRLYQYAGDFSSSHKYLLEALELYKQSGDTSKMLTVYNQIATNYDNVNKYKEGLQIADSALILAGQDDNHRAFVQTTRAHFLARLSHYKEAIEGIEFSNEIYKKNGDLSGLGINLTTLSAIYYEKKELDSALHFAKMSKKIFEELNAPYDIDNSNYNIATFLMEKGEYERAIPIARSCLEFAEANGLMESIRSSYELLSQLSAAIGDYQNAFNYATKMNMTKDSLFQEEKEKLVADMNARYENDLMQEKINSQHQAILSLERSSQTEKQLRILLIVAISLLLILAFVLIGRYRQKRHTAAILLEKNKKIEIQKQEIELINVELEKRLLRAQMNPHFIFNSLNSIQHFITVQDTHSALLYMGKLSKLIRQVLVNSLHINVPIKNEIQLLTNYMELERLRFEDKFEFQIVVDENINLDKQEVPFLLLQPIVENSILHGFSTKEDKGKILVYFERLNDQIKCIIEDNGIGRENAMKREPTDHQSISTQVIGKRLEILNRKRDEKVYYQIFDLTDSDNHSIGTRVEISFPQDLNS